MDVIEIGPSVSLSVYFAFFGTMGTLMIIALLYDKYSDNEEKKDLLFILTPIIVIALIGLDIFLFSREMNVRSEVDQQRIEQIEANYGVEMPRDNLRELHWPNLLNWPDLFTDDFEDPDALHKYGTTKLISVDENTINIKYIALVSENGKMKLYEYDDNDNKELLDELPRVRG